MKPNLIHICFVLDESASMCRYTEDIIDGFQNFINEQKKIIEGECIVSVYKFSDKICNDYIGKLVNNIQGLTFNPSGATSITDGIGTAIDEIGIWLNDMDESQRPSKNLIVILTDGVDNFSEKYSLDKVREMIRHQEEKYNWSFAYIKINSNSFDSKNDIINRCKYISEYSVMFRKSNNEADKILSVELINEKL